MDDSFENGQEISTNDGILLKKGPAVFLQEILNNTTGTLSLVHYATKNNALCIEWKPCDHFLISDADTQEPDDWSFVDTIAKRQRTISESLVFNTSTGTITHKDGPPSGAAQQQPQLQPTKARIIRATINDLRHIEVLKNGHIIRLVQKSDGKAHSEYFFQHGNADGFVRTLQTTHCLQRSRNNKNLFEIIDNIEYDHEKLQTTFAELKIDDIKGSGGWISNMVRNPIGHTIDFLAKMSDAYTVVPDLVNTYSGGGGSPRRSPTEERGNVSSSMGTSTNDEYEVLGTSPRQSSETSETAKNNLNGFNEPKLPPRPDVVRGSRLTDKQWSEFKLEDGQISDVERVKEIIFRGGIEHSLRSEVWKYLLNYYKWNHTNEQRIEYAKQKSREYYQMKLQWLSMTSVQQKNFSDYRDRKCQIEKDVKRTDRTLPFFAGDDNKNVALLQEILMTYVMYNFDLGYVQGMSDLLAPILFIMEKEEDAFWCFVGFMDIVWNNFDMDQAGMKRQLQDLQKLIALANPRLSNYFDQHGSENMYFCFRWLLVWFKREFSNSDIMELWEVLWTGMPAINFHLFISVAILDEQMNHFIDNEFGFNEILKHVNELSYKIDLQLSLKKAEAIFLQIKAADCLTNDVRLIIGEEPIKDDNDQKSSDEEDDDNFDDIVEHCDPRTEIEIQQKIDEACERSMYNSFY